MTGFMRNGDCNVSLAHKAIGIGTSIPLLNLPNSELT